VAHEAGVDFQHVGWTLCKKVGIDNYYAFVNT